MRLKYWAFWAILAASTLSTTVIAQEGVRWEETSVDAALRRAAQARCLVLVHFWSPACTPCLKMDRNVFSQPDVAAAVEANYVPVKVNAEHFPHTCQQFGITALPTDMILTPQGQVVRRFQGAVSPVAYIAQLNEVAAEVRSKGTSQYVQRPNGPAPNDPGIAAARPINPSYQEPNWAGYRDGRGPADSVSQTAGGPGRGVPSQYGPSGLPSNRDGGMDQPVERQPWPAYAGATQPRSPQLQGPPATDGRDRGVPGNQDYATVQPPLDRRTTIPSDPGPATPRPPVAPDPAGAPDSLRDNPPFGLEGYCPVELCEKRRWVLGNRTWGAIHRGRTYLFAGPEEQRRFLADPDRYAPVISGDDVVMSLDRGQSVPGRREHGVFYQGQIYLFAGEESLGAFGKNPSRYADQVLQAMRSGPRTAQR
jgi:YHS domain-containing protein/thioredoxin-related protein